MSKKSFADLCLARAAAATPGPWDNRCKELSNTEIPTNIWSEHGYIAVTNGPFNSAIADAEFIAASRTDIVILAERLKRISGILRNINMNALIQYGPNEYFNKLADELEAMPEEK